ncbi:hypothetical protein EVJ58_g423 [Rhodofomes roseus]|uniref:Uncharacterized protein n=1 Tax=Rhodofomes roseus TaxID=34475 RepID=A0A4Y9Z3K4_9APHY|nr:hypothetical protein EVJ58_g423 [Rhodofomes roseus]
METRNEELCARLEQSQPELARATRARDAAVKKLRLMRDVVRDLIDERRVAGTAVHAGRSHQSEQADHRRSNGGNSESSSGESWDSLQLTDVGAESSMSEDVHVVPEVSKPSTPLPRRTLVLSDASNQSAPSKKWSPKITEEIPPARRGTASSWRGTVSTSPTKLDVAEQKPGSEEHPVKVARCGPSRSSRHNSKGGRVVRILRQPKQMNGLGGLGDGVDDPTKDASDTQPAGPVTTEIGWYLEYRHPPATALRPRGPLSYASLGAQLSLDDETMLRIESLESLGAPSMQIHVYRDMAFVCHPVVLEGPTSTYLISWGNVTVNANVKTYLTTGTERPIDAIFQLFIRTMGQDAAWYYLGAHKLLAVDVPSVWHTRLHDEEKRELVAGLEERWTWRDTPSAERIAHLIETGELGQCTVELESKGLEERSQAFVGRYLSRK